MRISDLTRDRRTVAVQIGDGVVNVTYRPGGITPESEDRLREMISEQRVGASLVALLSGVLLDWDLTDDDGVPYPTTPEALSKLPTLALMAVAQAISESIRPNPPSGEISAAGSLQAVR